MPKVRRLTCALAATVVSVAACKDSYSISDPPADASLDLQVRQNIGGWGVVPILPVAQQNPALVDLGRSLFFDKIMSGNRDVACATCHAAADHATDALSLPIGTGAITTGTTRSL